MCRHFDLFFLGVKNFQSSSIGGGGGVDFKWNGPNVIVLLEIPGTCGLCAGTLEHSIGVASSCKYNRKKSRCNH